MDRAGRRITEETDDGLLRRHGAGVVDVERTAGDVEVRGSEFIERACPGVIQHERASGLRVGARYGHRADLAFLFYRVNGLAFRESFNIGLVGIEVRGDLDGASGVRNVSGDFLRQERTTVEVQRAASVGEI